MKGKPFALIGVNSDRDLATARKAVEDNKLNWRSFWNGPQGPGGPIAREWKVKGWPTLVVIDEKFKIRYVGHNGSEAIKLSKDLTEKLQKKKKGEDDL